MLLSSAYRTKRCPRRSNSRSSSSSTRLLNRGERGPPWGVPSTLGLTNPFSITPAFRNARMSFNSRLSPTRFAICPISLSWFTRSKRPVKSTLLSVFPKTLDHQLPDVKGVGRPIFLDHPKLLGDQEFGVSTRHAKCVRHVSVRTACEKGGPNECV